MDRLHRLLRCVAERRSVRNTPTCEENQFLITASACPQLGEGKTRLPATFVIQTDPTLTIRNCDLRLNNEDNSDLHDLNAFASTGVGDVQVCFFYVKAISFRFFVLPGGGGYLSGGRGCPVPAVMEGPRDGAGYSSFCPPTTTCSSRVCRAETVQKSTSKILVFTSKFLKLATAFSLAVSCRCAL